MNPATIPTNKHYLLPPQLADELHWRLQKMFEKKLHRTGKQSVKFAEEKSSPVPKWW